MEIFDTFLIQKLVFKSRVI